MTGRASVVFTDTPRQAELPTFVRENALRLLEAHSSSAIRNSVTIRLSDVTYDEAAGTLTLKTERSQYFYMLVTNRCMDYQLGDGLSVREVFEFRKTVSPLSESRLGNQIGINGLVFTRDGYLLLEKRGKKKATWKDKYAQPISLAMKESDILEELKDGRLGDTPEAAEKVFRRIVLKTIRSNYGLTEKDILPFTLAGNFFGVARDLLEGGKPNLYFYVVADMDAVTFRKTMEERTRRAAEHPDEKGLPKLSADKLDSEYFLVDYRKIAVDFGYRLTLSARDMLRIRRKFFNARDAGRPGAAAPFPSVACGRARWMPRNIYAAFVQLSAAGFGVQGPKPLAVCPPILAAKAAPLRQSRETEQNSGCLRLPPAAQMGLVPPRPL